MTSLSECAVLVSFGNQIDSILNERVMDLHRLVNTNPFAGFIESVPAYASLAIFYDTRLVDQQKGNHLTAFDYVKSLLERWSEQQDFVAPPAPARIIDVPVLYDGEDLTYVADINQLSVQEVISLHTAGSYRVYMIGFLPGFAYMGSVDQRIASPRRQTHRTLVPPGSVGIAGLQTGIYPIASPGGWQLIGRTPKMVFDKSKDMPCFFQPGDCVRFYSIDEIEFSRCNEY
ncbi:MAG: 5-oxoprolinase subunit PxpB [Bacteroidetes bacterium]|nr:5-oxoprolinase subunit PxpB [Bacteroidota bacterium]